MSRIAALGLAGAWIVVSVSIPFGSHGLSGTLIAILLLVQAIYWRNPVFCGIALADAVAVLLLHDLAFGSSPVLLLTRFTCAGTTIWLLGTVLAALPRSRSARAFAIAADVLGTGMFVTAATLAYLPVFAAEMALPSLRIDEFGLPMRGLAIVWGIGIAGRRAHPAATSLLGVTLLAAIGSAFVTHDGDPIWLPMVWVMTGLVAIPVSWMLGQRRAGLDPTCDADRRLAAFDGPLTYGLLGIFGLAALGTLPFFAIELRSAGLLGIAGLFLLPWLRRLDHLREPALVLLNWQVLTLAAGLLTPGIRSLFALDQAHAEVLFVPIATLAAASLLAWRHTAERRDASFLAMIHHVALFGTWAALLILSLERSVLSVP